MVNRTLIFGRRFQGAATGHHLSVISLVAGAFGFINVSDVTRRISFVLFALFFIGFLIFLGFALLVVDAVSAPALLLD